MPPLGARNNEVNMPDMGSVLDFLKDENEQGPATANAPYSLQMNTTKEGVPILVRQNANGNGNAIKLSTSSAALDLALSQSPGPDNQPSGWSSHRHRQAQQSLPTNTLRKDSQADEYDVQRNGNGDKTPKSTASNRRSIDLYALTSPQRAAYTNGMPKLQQSFSSNDVPTLKNGDAINNSGFGPKTHAEQHLRNHNANLGRVPANVNSRHSRELSTGFASTAPYGSGLHASATPFGPILPSQVTTVAGTMPTATVASPGPSYSMYSNGASPGPAYVNYGMTALANNMGGMSLSQGPMYQPMYAQQYGPPYPQYTAFGGDGQVRDSQARVIQSRRMQNGMVISQTFHVVIANMGSVVDANRFMNYDLKTMARPDIYTLCKDQHGCRFLQKKLEEKDPENVQIIFEETAPHVVELMTGKSPRPSLASLGVTPSSVTAASRL
jgi:hypothetical protein